MKEYKIVCDMKVENVRTGKTFYKKGVAPFVSGSASEHTIYIDHEKACDALIRTIERCAVFDAKTKENIKYYKGVYELMYTQSNIRIVSRTVTDWE